MTIDYRDAKLFWPGLYKNVHEILGDAHVILPFGDQLVAGKVTSNKFEAKQMGATGPTDLTWTANEALALFDTSFDLTDPANWKGIIPILTFNGSNEEADTPDDGFWSRDDAGGANGFSVGAWVWMTDATSSAILAKYDETGAAEAREWLFYINSGDVLQLIIYDESLNLGPRRAAGDAMVQLRWVFVVATYDGGGGATAADGITMYINGSANNAAASNQGSYIGMENLGTIVTLGHSLSSGGTAFFDGKMAGGPMGPFFTHKELSAIEVLDLYHIGAHALGLN